MIKKEYLETLEEEKYSYQGSDLAKGINIGLDKAIRYAEKLVEPEKAVLNKAEAEWIDKLKVEQEKRTFCDEYDLLYFITRQGFSHGFTIDVANGKETPEETITLEGYDKDAKRRLVNALLYGYTIEPEKLYTAKLKSTGEYLRYDTDGDRVHHAITLDSVVKRCENYHFTKDTLVKYSAWGNDSYDVNEVEE